MRLRFRRDGGLVDLRPGRRRGEAALGSEGTGGVPLSPSRYSPYSELLWTGSLMCQCYCPQASPVPQTGFNEINVSEMKNYEHVECKDTLNCQVHSTSIKRSERHAKIHQKFENEMLHQIMPLRGGGNGKKGKYDELKVANARIPAEIIDEYFKEKLVEWCKEKESDVNKVIVASTTAFTRAQVAAGLMEDAQFEGLNEESRINFERLVIPVVFQRHTFCACFIRSENVVHLYDSMKDKEIVHGSVTVQNAIIKVIQFVTQNQANPTFQFDQFAKKKNDLDDCIVYLISAMNSSITNSDYDRFGVSANEIKNHMFSILTKSKGTLEKRRPMQNVDILRELRDHSEQINTVILDDYIRKITSTYTEEDTVFSLSSIYDHFNHNQAALRNGTLRQMEGEEITAAFANMNDSIRKTATRILFAVHDATKQHFWFAEYEKESGIVNIYDSIKGGYVQKNFSRHFIGLALHELIKYVYPNARMPIFCWPSAAQQPDGINCGIFTSYFYECAMKKVHIPDQTFNFNFNEYRTKMIQVLESGNQQEVRNAIPNVKSDEWTQVKPRRSQRSKNEGFKKPRTPPWRKDSWKRKALTPDVIPEVEITRPYNVLEEINLDGDVFADVEVPFSEIQDPQRRLMQRTVQKAFENIVQFFDSGNTVLLNISASESLRHADANHKYKTVRSFIHKYSAEKCKVMERMLLPLVDDKRNGHFLFALFEKSSNTLTIYDSLWSTAKTYEWNRTSVRRLIAHVMKIKTEITVKTATCTEQKREVDSGVYAIRFAINACSNGKDTEDDFDASEFRKEIFELVMHCERFKTNLTKNNKIVKSSVSAKAKTPQLNSEPVEQTRLDFAKIKSQLKSKQKTPDVEVVEACILKIGQDAPTTKAVICEYSLIKGTTSMELDAICMKSYKGEINEYQLAQFVIVDDKRKTHFFYSDFTWSTGIMRICDSDKYASHDDYSDVIDNVRKFVSRIKATNAFECVLEECKQQSKGAKHCSWFFACKYAECALKHLEFTLDGFNWMLYKSTLLSMFIEDDERTKKESVMRSDKRKSLESSSTVNESSPRITRSRSPLSAERQFNCVNNMTPIKVALPCTNKESLTKRIVHTPKRKSDFTDIACSLKKRREGIYESPSVLLSQMSDLHIIKTPASPTPLRKRKAENEVAPSPSTILCGMNHLNVSTPKRVSTRQPKKLFVPYQAQFSTAKSDAPIAKMSYDSLKKLDDNQWLNDEVVHCAIQAICYNKNIFLIDPVQYERYCTNLESMQKLRTNNFSNYDMIMFPLVNDNHFMLTVIDMLSPLFVMVYDSLNKVDRNELYRIQNCINHLTGLRVMAVPSGDDQTTLQSDGCNCGPITIFHALQIVNNRPTVVPHFDAASYRKQLKHYLMTCKLIKILGGNEDNVAPDCTPRSRRSSSRSSIGSVASMRSVASSTMSVRSNESDYSSESLEMLKTFGWTHQPRRGKPCDVSVSAISLYAAYAGGQFDSSIIEAMLKVLVAESKQSIFVFSHSVMMDCIARSTASEIKSNMKQKIIFVPLKEQNEWILGVIEMKPEITIRLYDKERRDNVMAQLSNFVEITFGKPVVLDKKRSNQVCKYSTPEESASALFFNAEQYLCELSKQIKKRFDEFKSAVYREIITKMLIDSKMVRICAQSNTAAKEVVQIIPFKCDDLSDRDISLLSEEHDQLSDLIISKFAIALNSNKRYVALPLDAYEINGRLEGFNAGRRQGILMHVKKTSDEYALVVIKDRKACVYDPYIPAVGSKFSEKIKAVASYYNRNRAKCELKKKYPKIKSPLSTGIFVCALMHALSVDNMDMPKSVESKAVKRIICQALELNKDISVSQDITDTAVIDNESGIVTTPQSGTKEYKRKLMQQLRKAQPQLMRAQINYSNLPEPYVLPPQVKCVHCQAWRWPGDPDSICCKGGQVKIQDDFPLFVDIEEMRKIKEYILSPAGKATYDTVRMINSPLSFVCAIMNTKKKSEFPKGGPVPLVLNGRIEATIVSPQDSTSKSNPSFVSLIICKDSARAEKACADFMKKYNVKYNLDIFMRVRNVIQEHNHLAKCYMRLEEVIQEEKKKAEARNRKPNHVMLNILDREEALKQFSPNIQAGGKMIHVNPPIHPGRLNEPQGDKFMSAIYVYPDGQCPSHEDLNRGVRIFQKSSWTNKKLVHFSQLWDAMSYTLLLPRGNRTYKLGMPNFTTMSKRNPLPGVKPREFLSRSEYYNFTFADKGNTPEERRMHWCRYWGMLTQQFQLGVYLRIQADRLAAIKREREEQVNKLTKVSANAKYVQMKLEEKGYALGNYVTLPESFYGGPKYFRRLYYQCVALSKRYGKPSRFITFTGNPEWPEITEILKLISPNMTWHDIADDVCRIFWLKAKEFLKDVTERGVLGEVVANVWNVEYQQRGMPHIHLLIWFKKGHVDTPEIIDQTISAEIPPEPAQDDPYYEEKMRHRELIKKCMIHGPCEGKLDMTCRKRRPNAFLCAKSYPKGYRDETEMIENDYPLYRRRDNGANIVYSKGKNVRVATNRHVVPHNPYLLMKYGCHINVEASTSISTFKYIFKYIFKGVDLLALEIDDMEEDELNANGIVLRNEYQKKDGKVRQLVDLDETKTFQNARSISSIEASYCRLGLPRHGISHCVTALYIHLEGEQHMVVKADDTAAQREQRAERAISRFMAFMELNTRDEDARKLTYLEVEERYRWDQKAKMYKPYVRTGQIERNIAYLSPISPRNRELYGLHCLVRSLTGYTCFADLLKSEDGNTTYATFDESARARGLLRDDKEWDECLNLASETIPNNRAFLRLFCVILMNCQSPSPAELFEKYKEHMLDRDKQKKYSEEEKEQRVLRHIQSIIRHSNMTLKQFGLPELIRNEALERKFMSEDKREAEKRADEMQPTLNDGQKAISEQIIAAISDTSAKKRCFFVTGSGGCGKTYLYEYLINWCIAHEKVVLPVASTGIAATLLKNGTTAHSGFGIPLEYDELDKTNLDITSDKGQVLRQVEVIIWDEAPMQSNAILSFVDRTMRVAAPRDQKDRPFGGRVVLLGGDWKQILPVIPSARDRQILNYTLNNAPVYDKFEQCKLTVNMRVDKDQQIFLKYQTEVGEGTAKFDGLHIRVPERMLCADDDALIQSVYPEEVRCNGEEMSKRAILAVRNDAVIKLNEKIMNLLPGKAEEFIGITEIPEEAEHMGMPVDLISTLEAMTPNGMPAHKLVLKPQTPVMLLRNIDIENKLCNGTKLVFLNAVKVNSADRNVILLRCRNVTVNPPEEVFLPRIVLNYLDRNSGVQFTRRQFPIRACFACTINKSQGQTLARVGLDLRTPTFSHGHFYVAISRVKTEAHLKLLIPKEFITEDKVNGKHAVVRNIVYRDLFKTVNCEITKSPPVLAEEPDVDPFEGLNLDDDEGAENDPEEHEEDIEQVQEIDQEQLEKDLDDFTYQLQQEIAAKQNGEVAEKKITDKNAAVNDDIVQAMPEIDDDVHFFSDDEEGNLEYVVSSE